MSPLRDRDPDAVKRGRLIRDARRKRGLKQHELAEILGTSKASVSNWERGVHNPDGAVPRLEEALDISLSDGEEERIAESYTHEAVLDALRRAERELDRARAIVRRIITDGEDTKRTD